MTVCRRHRQACCEQRVPVVVVLDSVDQSQVHSYDLPSVAIIHGYDVTS